MSGLKLESIQGTYEPRERECQQSRAAHVWNGQARAQVSRGPAAAGCGHGRLKVVYGTPTMGRRSCLLVIFSRSQVCSPDSCFPGMSHRLHTFALTVCRAESDRKIAWAGRF